MRAVVGCLMLALVATTAADLCEWCNCTPKKNPTAIGCVCKDPEHTTLVLGKNHTSELKNIEKLTVSRCSIVGLQDKSFTEAHNLHTVAIDNAHQASISNDVFSTLSFLLLDTVNYLELKEKAFEGVKNLNNILIRNTHIPKLPPRVIFNLPDLKELKLDNVTINETKKEAICLQNSEASSITIVDSKIEHVEEGGIVLASVNEVNFHNNKLTSVAKNGITVVSHVAVNFTGNTLEDNVTSDSTNITSKSISVIGNVFSNIPTALHTESSDKLTFSNNTVLQEDWDFNLLQTLANWTSSGNTFPCKCSYKERLPVETGSDALLRWLDLNYCNVDCKLPLTKLREMCQKESDKDDKICNEEDSLGSATSDHSGDNVTSHSSTNTITTPTAVSPSNSQLQTSPDKGGGSLVTAAGLTITFISLSFIIVFSNIATALHTE